MKVLFRFFPITIKSNSYFFVDLPELPQVGDYIPFELIDEPIRNEFWLNSKVLDVNKVSFTYVRGREFTNDGKIAYLLGTNPNKAVVYYFLDQKSNDRIVFQELNAMPRVGELVQTPIGTRRIQFISHQDTGYGMLWFEEKIRNNED